MSRPIYRLLLVATAAAAGVAALLGGPSHADTLAVNIQDRAGEFFPNSITVHAGDTVKWVNHGLQPHTVTADSGLFDSGPIASQKAYAVAFPNVGTFPYHCTIHASTGTVVVVAAQTSATTAAPPPPPPASGNHTARPSTGSPTSVPTATPAPTPAPGPDTVDLTTSATYPSITPRLIPPRVAPPALATSARHGLPGPVRLLLLLVAALAVAGLAWETLRGRVLVPALPDGTRPSPRPPWRAAAFGVDVPPWDERDLL